MAANTDWHTPGTTRQLLQTRRQFTSDDAVEFGIQDTFSIELPIRPLFAAGTIDQLARVHRYVSKDPDKGEETIGMAGPIPISRSQSTFLFRTWGEW